MINGDNYMNIISKLAIEKMSFKIESHPQLYKII